MSEEHRLVRWFDQGERFAGKYVILDNGEQLELHVHVFPDGNYTLLALPRDPDQFWSFLERITSKMAERTA